jgi:hypothetical protein
LPEPLHATNVAAAARATATSATATSLTLEGPPMAPSCPTECTPRAVS